MKAYLLRALTRSLSLAPVRLLQLLSRPLGSLLWRLSATRRNTTRRNLEACFPGLNESERESLARASMRHLVLTALETGMCWHWSRDRLERHFRKPVGLAGLERAVESGAGVLMLLPHYGNWELLSHWLQPRFGLMALYKAGGDAWVDDLLLRERSRMGADMAPTTGAGLKRIYRRLRDGGLVLILPDQDPADGKGRFAPFFDTPALTGVLAARLVQQTGCRVVFAACRRMSGQHYQPHFIAADRAIYSTDLDQALAALNRGVEEIIKLDPEQYLWAYKRFKSRPPGAPPFYS